MAFTSAGLPNGGRTAHYQFAYDTALSPADGVQRTAALMASAEADWNLMASWFPGVGFDFSFPINVNVGTGSNGASWQDPSGFQKLFGYTITVSINPGSGTSANVLRYLLVSEVTEMWMESQDQGWSEQSSFFQGADEGSMGEGLSRFLGVQFQLANGLGPVPPPGFSIAWRWLNGGRPNFVDSAPDDNQPDPTTGCATAFIYFLHDQLNYSITQIVGAASTQNLADVYHKLTGRNDAWSAFIGLVQSHYPSGRNYNPVGDSLFPVSNLAQFLSPGAITTGYTGATLVTLDRPAKAEVVIALASDDPATVSVPATVTIPVGGTTISVPIQTAAIPGPFGSRHVNVHAIYAGKTLTMSVQVVPPALSSFTLAPDTVTAGDNTTGKLTLDRPSLAGPVVVNLINAAPGFANVPPQVTIPQNQGSVSFTIGTPPIGIAFKTAHASMDATYGASVASAVLTVKSRVVAGILNSLTVTPSTVSAGEYASGRVTLVEAVPVPTVVGLAAFEANVGPGGPIPGPPGLSSIASVPNSITIPAGSTIGYFTVTTYGTPVLHNKRHVQIMAVAVVFKYAALTVET